MSSFHDQGPQPQSIQHEGKRYTIHPRILSGKAVRAVRAHMCELEDREIKRLLAEHELTEEQKARVVEKWAPRHVVSMGDMLASLRVPEALATALMHSCDQLPTYEAAIEFVDNYPNYFELLDVAAKAMGVELLKNSNSPVPATEPGTDQASDAEAQPSS